jgi:hypothetical protein
MTNSHAREEREELQGERDAIQRLLDGTTNIAELPASRIEVRIWHDAVTHVDSLHALAANRAAFIRYYLLREAARLDDEIRTLTEVPQ